MTDQACPLPTPAGDDEREVIQRMLSAQRIAVVGLSDNPQRASYEVAGYLQSQGKTIIPVNPTVQSVLGQKSHSSLQALGEPIDIVVVFRRPEYCEEVTRQAIAAGARGVWLQLGITSEPARKLAQQAGIDFIQNRCIMVEHRRAT